MDWGEHGYRWIRTVVLVSCVSVGAPSQIILARSEIELANSRTTLLQQATDFVREEAEDLSGTSDAESVAFRYYASLSALVLVQSRLSTSRYALHSRNAGFVIPYTPEESLRQGVGICGQHFATFQAILSGLGIETRAVQVFWQDSLGIRQNHIFPEVIWAGKWHMFDVTNGFVPAGPEKFSVLSLEEVRAGVSYSPLMQGADPRYRMKVGIGYDSLQYLTEKNLAVLTDLFGTIRPYVKTSTAYSIKFGLDDLIDFVGMHGGKYPPAKPGALGLSRSKRLFGAADAAP
jgi:hypothetical protein